jgi:hypothetical protein
MIDDSNNCLKKQNCPPPAKRRDRVCNALDALPIGNLAKVMQVHPFI